MSSRSGSWTVTAMSRTQAINGPSSPLAILEPPQMGEAVTLVSAPPRAPRPSTLPPRHDGGCCGVCRRWNRLKTGETNFGHCCALKGKPYPFWKTAPEQYVVTHKVHGEDCARFERR
jgi:hypothetical protein